ncbi:MAG: ABC transporter ATP-binding protein, partial [Mesorhizobium sp.]
MTRLFAEMTPREHVTLTVLQREGKATGIIGRFLGNHTVAEEVDDLLDVLGLAEKADRPVGEIAYG